MNDPIPDPSPNERSRPPRLRLGQLALVLVGFVLGAGVFAWPSSERAAPDRHAHAPDASAGTTWTCSMHPQIQQPEPGRCPICGMDLIPIGSDDHDGDDRPRVFLSERARALARLRTAPVHRQGDAAADLRLLGRIEPNERTLKTVTAWTGGRIDHLHVNVTGERVRAGQVIATLYSPEILAAHQDLLVAKAQVAQLKDSPQASREAALAALEAARDRLRLLGVPDDALARMEASSRPTRSIAIRSPYSGTVIERLATEGAYIDTGSPLYRVADLRTLWVQLDAYESDLPRLDLGQPVRLTVRALPGEVFEGRLTFIDPTLDLTRRTAQVRVQVRNPGGRLRPGMFAEATVSTAEPAPGRSPLVVPATAPLFTGRRAIVYVEVEAGDRVAYEPRTVRLGPRLGDFYPVVAGLSEGERVVVRGAFAIDADLQIRGGPSMMAAGDDTESGAWGAIVALSSADRERLGPVVSAYLSIQEALADDAVDPAKKAAHALAKAARRIRLAGEAQSVWEASAQTLSKQAKRVGMAKTLEQAREGFEPLSQAIIRLLGRFGNPLDRPLRLAFCPMAAGSEGAFWVQPGDEVDNAYFGASMLTCGEIRQEIDPGAYLPASEVEEASR